MNKKGGNKKMNGFEKFTVRETATMLSRSRDTIYRWIEEGYIQHYFRVRDGYLIPQSEINRILVEKKQFPAKNH
jgi:excisionase family DNA binding protein